MADRIVVALKPTPEEQRTIERLRAQGVTVLVAWSEAELEQLKASFSDRSDNTRSAAVK